MGSGGPQGRLLHPLRPSASSVGSPSLLAGVLPAVHQGSRPSPGTSTSPGQGSHRKGPSISGLLQPPVPRSEALRCLASHYRPLGLEQIRDIDSFSYGNSPVGPQFYPSGRLDDLSGLTRRVQSSSNSSRFASLSSFCGPRERLSVQGPVFWSDVSSTGLHEGHGSSFCHSPQVRSQDAPLLGRLACPSLIEKRMPTSEGQAPSDLRRTRHSYQSPEIVTQPNSGPHISRYGNSVSSVCGPSYPKSSRQPPGHHTGVLIFPSSSCSPLASSSGTPVLPDLVSTGRHVKDEVPSVLPKEAVELRGRPTTSPVVSPLSVGSPVVASNGSPSGRGTSLPPGTGHMLFLGRIRRGLGSSSGATPFSGPVVSSAESPLYQHEGTDGRSPGSPVPGTSSDRQDGSVVLRQHHCSRLSPSFGRDLLFASQQQGKRDPLMGRSRSLSPPSAVHRGLLQRSGGRTESSGPSHRVRMDSPSRSSQSTSSQMACPGRSVRDVAQSQAEQLLLTGSGSNGPGDGCFPPSMERTTGLRLSSICHHKESVSQTAVISELRVNTHSSVLAATGLVPGSPGTVVRCSSRTTQTKRSVKTASHAPFPSKFTHASADCVATVKRFARQAGFSAAVAGQLALCRRKSTRMNYQTKWTFFRRWCKTNGHRSSRPTIPKIADFLTFLFKNEGAAISTVKGYRSMLAAVYRFPLPEISSSPVLKDLIRSFEISKPRPLFPTPPWDLDKVLEYLAGPPFEPLSKASFLDKTRKALFLLAMATAKRVSELQALSFSVSYQGEDLVLYYDPFFRAKTESVSNPLPRSVVVPSLEDFVGDLPERVHCPVRAIRYLRRAARSSSYIPSRLFMSPKNPKRPMSKNGISYYLRNLVRESGAVSSSHAPRAHDIRGIATSLNYYSNLSLCNLKRVATWRSDRVFASRYLKDVSSTRENIRRFGTLVIAGDRLPPGPSQRRH